MLDCEKDLCQREHRSVQHTMMLVNNFLRIKSSHRVMMLILMIMMMANGIPPCVWTMVGGYSGDDCNAARIETLLQSQTA